MIARQGIKHFFAPEREPVGVVLPSILVVYGEYCRLELVGEDGRWRKSHRFRVGEREYNRVEGEPVPKPLMRQWRKLREAEPQLFSSEEVLVWAQPAAFCDEILHMWQQERESEEAESAPVLRLCDAFAGAWTESAAEARWLLSQIQIQVPPGCTALVQVTDTAFASQAKAAAEQEKEELRRLLRLKAAQEGVHPSYTVSPREIYRVARQMHRAMVELNSRESTVLAEARRCGWLHWRPGPDRKLALAEREEWARWRPEGSHRLPWRYFRDRSLWVEDGKPLPVEDRYQEEAKFLLESHQGEGLQLDLEVKGLVPEEEEEAVLELHLHPLDRKAALELELSKLPSQAKVSKKLSKVQKWADRLKRSKRWKEALGKKTVEQRLKELVPQVKGKKKKKLSKLLKKKGKASKVAKNKKKEEKKKAVVALADEEEKAGPWVGKKVRLVGENLLRYLRNKEGEVRRQKEEAGEELVEVQLGLVSCRWVKAAEVVEVKPGALAAFPGQLDFRKLSREDKGQVRAALAGPAVELKVGNYLESPEMAAALVELELRLRQAPSPGREQRSRPVLLSPVTTDLALQQWATGSGTEEAQLSAWQLRNQVAGSELVLAPLHSAGPPQHWTLLVLEREEAGAGEWKVRCYDSLQPRSEPAAAQAANLVDLLQAGVLPGELSSRREQTDGHSCGWFCLMWAEEELREWRGETRKLLEPAEREKVSYLNRLFGSCQGRARGREVSEAVVPAEAPPLPPPAEVPQTAARVEEFGCSRCRWNKRGCLQCNPAKAIEYGMKKEKEGKRRQG